MREVNTTKLSTLTLTYGSMSAMEAVAWIADEARTDTPMCACPVITSLISGWDRHIRSDAERNRLLLPLVPKLVGSRATSAVEEQRSLMALDWLVREHSPSWLDLREDLKVHAAALRGLSPIVDLRAVATFVATDSTTPRVVINAAYAASSASVRAAARVVALNYHVADFGVVRDAAIAAITASSAFSAAADAARAFALGAPLAAVRDTVLDAVISISIGAAHAHLTENRYDPAKKTLPSAMKHVQAQLQESALALVERMIEVR